MTVANLTFVITSDGPTSKDVVVLVCFSWVPQIYVFIQSLRVYLNCKCSNFSYRRRLSCLLDLNASVTRQEKAFIFATQTISLPDFIFWRYKHQPCSFSVKSAFDYLEQTVPGCSVGTHRASIRSDTVRLPLLRCAPPALWGTVLPPFHRPGWQARIAPYSSWHPAIPSMATPNLNRGPRENAIASVFSKRAILFILFKGKESCVAIFSSHEYKLYLCV